MGGNSSKFAHPVAVPPSVDILLKHRHRFRELTPQAPKRDAPIASIYRMYSAVVCGEIGAFKEDIDYFWSHADWQVSKVPDPNDHEPARYAILAAITLLLVDVFNGRIKAGDTRGSSKHKPKGPDSAPRWVERVPPLEEPLLIPAPDNTVLEDRNDKDVDQFMLKKNVITKTLDVFSG